MLITAAGSVAPKTRKGRVVATRPLTMLIISGSADTTVDLRLQRLRMLGIIGHRADLLASLAWGEAA